MGNKAGKSPPVSFNTIDDCRQQVELTQQLLTNITKKIEKELSGCELNQLPPKAQSLIKTFEQDGTFLKFAALSAVEQKLDALKRDKDPSYDTKGGKALLGTIDQICGLADKKQIALKKLCSNDYLDVDQGNEALQELGLPPLVETRLAKDSPVLALSDVGNRSEYLPHGLPSDFAVMNYGNSSGDATLESRIKEHEAKLKQAIDQGNEQEAERIGSLLGKYKAARVVRAKQ